MREPMPSAALNTWSTTRAAALDEIEAGHRAVGGSGPGRRYATQQLNQAYAVLLSSHFQGFCRDLHSDCAEVVVRVGVGASLHSLVRSQFILARRIDSGNPNPGNLGADFGRFSFAFWPAVIAESAGNQHRRALLEELNTWRNAIAHQDFDPARLGPLMTLQLEQVRRWRRACNRLALSFDNVMRVQLTSLIGRVPWS